MLQLFTIFCTELYVTHLFSFSSLFELVLILFPVFFTSQYSDRWYKSFKVTLEIQTNSYLIYEIFALISKKKINSLGLMEIEGLYGPY